MVGRGHFCFGEWVVGFSVGARHETESRRRWQPRALGAGHGPCLSRARCCGWPLGSSSWTTFGRDGWTVQALSCPRWAMLPGKRRLKSAPLVRFDATAGHGFMQVLPTWWL